MSMQIWLARLSEGWCPRPEHGRLAGDSRRFCVPCCVDWSAPGGVPVAELVHVPTPTSLHWLRDPIRQPLTEADADAQLAFIDAHAKRQDEATSAAIRLLTPSYGRWES